MKLRDLFLAAFAVLVLGVNFVAVKTAVGYIPPLFLTGVRFSLVAVVLVWFFPLPRGMWFPIFIFSLAQGLLHHGLMFTGMVGMDAAITAIVMQLCTPFAAGFAWIMLGERFGWRRSSGVAIALFGVSLIAGQPEIWQANLSLVLLVFSAMCWGYASVYVKRLGNINILQVTAWMAVFATPELFIASAFLETGQFDALMNAPSIVWFCLAYMSLGATVLGYGIWYYLLQHYDVAQIIPFALLNPVIGVVSSIVLLGEVVTWEKAIGGVIVLVGVAIIQLRWHRVVAPAD